MLTALHQLHTSLLDLGSASEAQATEALMVVLAAVIIFIALGLFWALFGQLIRWAFHWALAIAGVGLIAWGLTVLTAALTATGVTQ